MPGKHAPSSPKSFYLSLARFFGVALAIVALVAVAGVMLVSGGDDEPAAAPTTTSSPSPTDEPTVSPTASPRVSPTATRTAGTLPPSRVTVDVLNGTTRTGLARRVANDLREDGYRIGEIGNAPAAERTTIYYREGGRDEARALLREHPELVRVSEATADTPGKALLTVVVGADYP